MTFAIQPDQPVAQGLLQAVLGQIDSAVTHLSAQDVDPVEAVHETRKAIKRLRTVLRLLRRAVGKKAFSEENRMLAGLGQLLSPARDAQVMVNVTTRLAEQTAGSPYAEAIVPVRTALQQRCPTQPLDEETLRDMLVRFQGLRERMEARLQELPPAKLRRSLRRGVRRMVRRGRHAYTLAYAEPTDDHFHAWRKRIKDLYYTSCLLHLTRPNRLAPLVDKLDELGDDLGDEHDLGVLASLIHGEPRGVGGAVPVALLLQLISRRRDELRQKLFGEGRELYKGPRGRLTRLVTGGIE